MKMKKEVQFSVCVFFEEILLSKNELLAVQLLYSCILFFFFNSAGPFSSVRIVVVSLS